MEKINNDKYNIDNIGKTPISNEDFYILEFDNDPEVPNRDKEILFARYNPVFKCFYDYRIRNLGSITFPNSLDESKLQVGLLVDFSEENLDRPEIVASDDAEVNKEIVERYRIDYKAISKKYEGKSLDGIECDLFDTINSYCEDRIKMGQDVDPYIADIVCIIGKAMGLKIRDKAFLNENIGFSFPEEMQRAVSGLYNLVDLKLNGIESFKNPTSFAFNGDGYISLDYDTFLRQLEYVSGISHEGIYSDVYNKVKEYTYNNTLSKAEIDDLKRKSPVISIHEDETLFYEDFTANRTPSIIVERGKTYFNWNFLNDEKSSGILI